MRVAKRSDRGMATGAKTIVLIDIFVNEMRLLKQKDDLRSKGEPIPLDLKSMKVSTDVEFAKRLGIVPSSQVLELLNTSAEAREFFSYRKEKLRRREVLESVLKLRKKTYSGSGEKKEGKTLPETIASIIQIVLDVRRQLQGLEQPLSRGELMTKHTVGRRVVEKALACLNLDERLERDSRIKPASVVTTNRIEMVEDQLQILVQQKEHIGKETRKKIASMLLQKAEEILSAEVDPQPT